MDNHKFDSEELRSHSTKHGKEISSSIFQEDHIDTILGKKESEKVHLFYQFTMYYT